MFWLVDGGDDAESIKSRAWLLLPLCCCRSDHEVCLVARNLKKRAKSQGLAFSSTYCNAGANVKYRYFGLLTALTMKRGKSRSLYCHTSYNAAEAMVKCISSWWSEREVEALTFPLCICMLELMFHTPRRDKHVLSLIFWLVGGDDKAKEKSKPWLTLLVCCCRSHNEVRLSTRNLSSVQCSGSLTAAIMKSSKSRDLDFFSYFIG